MDLFNLEHERQKEAKRRLTMLGEYAHRSYTQKELLVLARERFIPCSTLVAWKHAYTQGGLEALLPQEWSLLSLQAQQIVAQRLELVEDITQTLMITEKDLQRIEHMMSQHTSKTGRVSRKTERLVRRYRVHGLWGLAPECNPEKKRRPPLPSPELTATTDESIFDEIDRRRQVLGDKLFQKAVNHEKISDSEVVARSAEIKRLIEQCLEAGEDPARWKGNSRSRLWDYIRDVRRYKSKGLAPQQRSDRGSYHNLSPRMEHIIRGLRLSKRDITLGEVLDEAGKRARGLGEPEPSYWHVRTICHRIPPEILALADGRERTFRNKYRLTHKEWFDGNTVVYQIDATQIDVLAKDTRTDNRKKSGEVRPWLTICVESFTGAIVSARFGYDPPNKFTVAAVIHDALLQEEGHVIGGIPDEIRVDRGKAMIAQHVQQIAADYGIVLKPCYIPEHKGKVERTFGTLNTRCWARIKGYVHSTIQHRNPKTKAAWTLPELVEQFWAFARQYNQEIVEATGKSRTETWAEYRHTMTVKDPDMLDALLEVTCQRNVGKEQIQYANRNYWSAELAGKVYTGQRVVIHAAPEYMQPESIEVYDLHGNKLGTAEDCDSASGREVTGQEVAEAQRRQRARDRLVILEERSYLKEADQEIERRGGEQSQSKSERAAREKKAAVEAGSPAADPVVPASTKATTTPSVSPAPPSKGNPPTPSANSKAPQGQNQTSRLRLAKQPTSSSAWDNLMRLEEQRVAER
jgi:transposase InsO family protein